MQTMTPPSPESTTWEPKPLSPNQVHRATELFEVLPGKKIPLAALQELLPDIETALFFAKAYKLDYTQLSSLLGQLFKTPVLTALLGEDHVHSHELQDFIVDVVPDYIQAEHGSGHYDDASPAPDTELLAQLFESLTVTIAESIAKVTNELAIVLDRMPSKYGSMVFSHLRDFNTQRNAIGTYKAQVVHDPVPPRLVIFDVSGSMTEETVKAIADEVVGLSYAVNASLAIVSNNAFFWDAGTFDTNDVLEKAEYWGTHYEMLAPILDQDWDTVITIADYDSSMSSLTYLRDNCKGRIREVLDISLVDQPSFLAKCVGLLANKVTPILIGNSRYVTGSRYQVQGY